MNLGGPSTCTRKHDADRPKTDFTLRSQLDGSMGAVQSRDFPMQPQAWYIHPPTGQPFGPCYTQSQAQIEAVRIVTKRLKLEDETALVLWRSLSRIGWSIKHTGTKLIVPTGPLPPWPISARTSKAFDQTLFDRRAP